MRKTVPSPTTLVTSISPSCMSTIERTIASPRPLPDALRLAGVRAAVEAIEDPRQLVGRDPRPAVAHLERCLLGPGREMDRYPTAARRELQRVADEVGEELDDALAVEAQLDGSAGHRAFETDAARDGHLRQRLDDDLHRVAQVAVAHVEREDAGIDARQVEQVGAQPLEPADLLGRALQELGPRRLIDVAVALELGVDLAARRSACAARG